MKPDKINLFEWLDSRRWTYSTLAKLMNFKNTVVQKGKVSKKREIKNYHSLYTLLRRARTQDAQISQETLIEIAKAFSVLKGYDVPADHIILK